MLAVNLGLFRVVYSVRGAGIVLLTWRHWRHDISGGGILHREHQLRTHIMSIFIMSIPLLGQRVRITSQTPIMQYSYIIMNSRRQLPLHVCFVRQRMHHQQPSPSTLSSRDAQGSVDLVLRFQVYRADGVGVLLCAMHMCVFFC